jgi:zinc transport system substrate-binding protein
MTIRFASAVILFCLGSLHSVSAGAYTLATSIRPLYGIARAVAGDTAEVSLILDTAVSPHDAPSRPSHILKITQADAILMVDRQFEQFLDRPLESYGGRRPVLEASKAPGVTVLSRQILNANPNFDWRTAPKTPQQLTGEENPRDFHIWLSPENGLAIARQVHDQLVQALPDRQAELDANLERFQQQLSYTVGQLRQQFMAAEGRGYLSSHDGYQYYNRAFGLRQTGTIGDSVVDQSDPAKREFILAEAAKPETSCLVRDTESKGRDAQMIAQKFRKPLITIDPLGQDLPLDGNLYLSLLFRMGAAFAGCLNPQGPIEN